MEGDHFVWMKTPINSIINCVSLKEIVLTGVRISQELLDSIFSSCRLLENINLRLSEEGEHRTIKIKNLVRIHEIRIYSWDGDTTDLEISGVPNLRLFRCELCFGHSERRDLRPFSAYSISLGSSVTELWLGGLITDESSLEMIESGFPFLESLTLNMECWTLGIFHFTCASLKRLSLMCSMLDRPMAVKVYAPKLLSFIFDGYTLPSLSFPFSALVKTKFKLLLFSIPLDASFFLKMREALTLSSKCDVCIRMLGYRQPTSDIDLDDLRTRLPFPPANNVQLLEFHAAHSTDGCCYPFLDALFEICHPKQVLAKPDVQSGHTNHFFELMVREVLDKKNMKTSRYWPRYLKHVQIGRHHKWITLRDSHRSIFLDRPINFKLKWR